MQKEELKENLKSGNQEQKIYDLIKEANLLRQSDSNRSAELSAEAAAIAEQIEDKVSYVSAKVSEAYARLYNSEFDLVQKLANELIRVGMRDDEPNVLGTAYNLKARVDYKTDNPGKALEMNLKALKYYLEEPRTVNLMSCYNNLGMCQEYQHNYDEALNYYNLALECAEEIDHSAKHVIMMNIGSIHFDRENYDEALKSYIRAHKMFEEANLLSNLASCNYNLGLTYQKLNELDKSMKYFRDTYAILQKLNDPKEICYTCDSIANVLIEIDKLDEALKYLDQALKLAKENNLTWNLSKIYHSCANFWEKKGEYKKSSEYLKKVIEMKELLNKEINNKNLSEMEAKYKTKIYKLKTKELNAKNKVITDQLQKMESKLQEQHIMYEKLEENFRQSVKKLNERDNLLSSQTRMATMGEMISLIAHQWKQPLNVIGVLVQSFRDAWEFDELSEDFINQQVDVIMKQIIYMSETISDFRDFFKPERNEFFDVKEAIEKSLKLLEYSLLKSNIELQMNLQNGCELFGAANDFVQVILNIVNNARQEMKNCSQKDCVVKIDLECNDNSLSISIYNSGSSLNEQVINRLFEPYFTTRGDEGTGIGLYICRMIIENKFNGKISAENLNDGVRFNIIVPVN